MNQASDGEGMTSTELLSGPNFTDYTHLTPAGNNNNDDEAVITVEMYDVLCGRDKNAFNNVGNRRFRVVVAMHLDQYVNVAKTRKEKSAIIRTIIDRTKSCGGRFLALRDGQYVVLTDRETHDKVGHAVRDMVQARSKGCNDTIQLSNGAAEFDANNDKDQATDIVQPSLLDFVSNIGSNEFTVPEVNTQSKMNTMGQPNLMNASSNFGFNPEYVHSVSNTAPTMDVRNAFENAVNTVPQQSNNNTFYQSTVDNMSPHLPQHVNNNYFHQHPIGNSNATANLQQNNTNVAPQINPQSNMNMTGQILSSNAVSDASTTTSFDANAANSNYYRQHPMGNSNATANLQQNNTNVVPEMNTQSNMNMMGRIHSINTVSDTSSTTSFDANTAAYLNPNSTLNEQTPFNNTVNPQTQHNTTDSNSFYQTTMENSFANFPQQNNSNNSNNNNNLNNNQMEQQFVQHVTQQNNYNFIMSQDSLLLPPRVPDSYFFNVENVAIQLANPLRGPMIEPTEIRSSNNNNIEPVESSNNNNNNINTGFVKNNNNYVGNNSVVPNNNIDNSVQQNTGTTIPNIHHTNNTSVPHEIDSNELEIDFSRKLSIDRFARQTISTRPSRRASIESLGTFGDCTIDTMLTNEKADVFIFDTSTAILSNMHDSYLTGWDFPCTPAESNDMEYILDLDHRFSNISQGNTLRGMSITNRRGSMENNNMMQGIVNRRGSMENYAMQGLNRRRSMETTQGYTRQASMGNRCGSMGTIPSINGRRTSVSTIGTIGEGDDLSMCTVNTNLFFPDPVGSNHSLIAIMSNNSTSSFERRNTIGSVTMSSTQQQRPRNSIGTESAHGRRGSMETHSTNGGTVDSDLLDQLVENMLTPH
jgi:hypothetical protein